MPCRPSIFALVLILQCGFFVARASAEGDPLAGSCDSNPVCAALAGEAREHSVAGRYEEAKRAYLQAYQRRADPRLLYNLARVLHKAGRSYEAATYYKSYLDAGAEGNDEQRIKAEGYYEQARKESAAQEKTGAQLEFSKTPPEGANGSQKPPLYTKWWLWTTVGVVVAGAALGIGLGLASRRPDSTGAIEARPF